MNLENKRHLPPILHVVAAFLLLSVATYVVYSPGFSGNFIFDDATNILTNEAIKISSLTPAELTSAALSGEAGILKRPISYLSFGLNYYFSGFNPYYFKLTNTIIHILNGIGIFLLTYFLITNLTPKITSCAHEKTAYLLSLAISLAWLLHPINLTSVLYIVQRMASLSAFFVIWGLVCYVLGRSNKNKTQSAALILCAFFVFWPLATFSKENGALFPLYTLLLEVLIFNKSTTRLNKINLLTAHVWAISALAFAFIFYTLLNPGWITSGYNHRAFTLAERLMTEPRVIWNYISLITLPTNKELGLFHDDVLLSKGLFSPITTIASIIAIATILFISVIYSKKAPILSFGILFFLSGHLLESSIFPLEIMHEHRNYLPSYGILLIACYYLTYPSFLTQTATLRKALLMLIICIFSFTTIQRASFWGNTTEHKIVEAINHPNSARANVSAGNTFYKLAKANPESAGKYISSAKTHFTKASELNPTNTAALFFITDMALQLTGQPDNKAFAELSLRLSKQPFFTSTTLHWLISSTNCINRCRFPPRITNKIIESTLDNNSLRGNTRARLLYSFSHFAHEKSNDPERAIKYLTEALAISPKTPIYYQYLVQLLYNSGRQNEARDVIRKHSHGLPKTANN
ncbi:tetratricopeptide repeat protein [Pseudomonadota bacterium]